jgi:peptidoglycan/LPS O-acetylase OafA/YrhL
MKKAIIVFVIAGLVLITTGFWFFSSNQSLKPFDIGSFGVILMIVIFAVVLGLRRLLSARRGEPAEDELSKKVLQRTAAWSYYVSLYLWVAVLYIKDKVSLDTEELIGAGILGMAVAFAVCWLIFNFSGMRNE